MVAPDMKEQFVGATDVNPHEDRDKQNSGSNSDTEGCTDNDDNNVVDGKDGSISDTETEDSNEADNDIKHAAMEEDDEATQQDSDDDDDDEDDGAGGDNDDDDSLDHMHG
ncbi:prostatic spermine-binding protein-like [Carica papaya]|uniref:prostatic spermine-binding protein-like n=1 Tax=Carica papaya TaxID=3649 RepID=UPI000B8CC7B2|nr:prostatic spermine-binding protein-like [Carica papaya]